MGDPGPRTCAIDLARAALEFYVAYAQARDIDTTDAIVKFIDATIDQRISRDRLVVKSRQADPDYDPPILALFKREQLLEVVTQILQQRAAPRRSVPRVHQHRAEGRGWTIIDCILAPIVGLARIVMRALGYRQTMSAAEEPGQCNEGRNSARGGASRETGETRETGAPALRSPRHRAQAQLNYSEERRCSIVPRYDNPRPDLAAMLLEPPADERIREQWATAGQCVWTGETAADRDALERMLLGGDIVI